MLLAASLLALQLPGLADTTRRATATHAMSVVDSARLHGASARSPAHALAPAVASATAITIDGVPGAAPFIVLRGGSVHKVNDPLVLIDGIVSRGPLSDIDVDDIDRIEVLNGPASTAAYGLGAANGVIRVFTRRGRHLPGAGTRFVARSEIATHLRPRILPVNQHRAADPDSIHDDDYPVSYDAPAALLQHRVVLANHLSAQQLDRTMVGGLFASLGHERDPGMLPLKSGFDEKAVRLNLDRVFGQRLSVDGDAFVLLASNDLPPNQGGLLSVLRFVEPNGKLDSLLSPCPNFDACYTATVPAGRLGPTTNPLRALQNSAIEDSRRRVRGGVNASYRLTHWLDARAGFTTDQTNLRTFSRFNLSSGPESTVDGETRTSFADAMLIVSRDLRGEIRTTTRVGWSRERSVRSSETIIVDPSGPSTSSAYEITDVLPSYFAATAIDVGRRLTLEAAIRRDEPSLYGSENRPIYHRFGANVRVTDGIRLRAAHGTSGVPLPDSVLLNIAVGTSPVAPLRLPFVHETEAGTSISLGRASLGYDFAVQRTVGHTMWVPTPASLGFTFQFMNMSDVTTRAHEMSLGAPLLDRQGLSWRMDLVAHRARSVMTRLNTPSFFFGNGAQFQLVEGQELNILPGTRWIRTQQQLAETIAAGQLTGTPADYVRNEEGYWVRATQHRTANEVPLAYARCAETGGSSCTVETLFDLGRTTPDVALGLTSSARLGRVSLHLGITGAIGGVIYDHGRSTDFLFERDEVIDQSAKPVAERKPGAYYRAFRTGFASERFVEDATHIKLRDVALDWRVWRRMSVGFVGRNLWTSSRYTGHDPDVAVPTANLFDRNVDRFQYPAPRMAGVVIKWLAPEPSIRPRTVPRRTA
jgi:hypothetical protein